MAVQTRTRSDLVYRVNVTRYSGEDINMTFSIYHASGGGYVLRKAWHGEDPWADEEEVNTEAAAKAAIDRCLAYCTAGSGEESELDEAEARHREEESIID